MLAQPEQFGEEMVLSAWTARFQLRKLTPLHDLAHEAFEKAGYEVAGLSPMERGVMLMSYLDSEVRNGGFSQWYFNDFGRFGLETQKALEKIGAAKHAEVVAKANRLFGWRGPPSTREKVQQALEAMSEKNAQVMDDLNDAWYELPSWQLQAAAWDWQRQTSGAQ